MNPFLVILFIFTGWYLLHVVVGVLVGLAFWGRAAAGGDGRRGKGTFILLAYASATTWPWARREAIAARIREVMSPSPPSRPDFNL